MRSTTFLTTIRVCPLESAESPESLSAREIGRARTVADTLPVPYKQGVSSSSLLAPTTCGPGSDALAFRRRAARARRRPLGPSSGPRLAAG